MTSPFTTRWLRLALVLIVGSGVGVLFSHSGPVGADTDASTLSGEGGTFLQPVVAKLIGDSASNMDGLFGAYVATGIDNGIGDFIGSAPNTFNADFAVSERPLTATEAATAKTDGRTYAYVPFAATPVAIGALVTDSLYSGEDPVDPGHFCPHIDLTADDVAAIFGLDSADPAGTWSDPRFVCSNGLAISSGQGIASAANADPSMANFAVEALMNSDPTATSYFAAGLQNQNLPASDSTPSELWPFEHGLVVAGGDDPFLGKLLNVNATTGVPAYAASLRGTALPVSSVWTGAPLGAAWNIPTAAVQNADSQFVAPSEGAAAAAEADATVAKTSDPTTNNLVTFTPSTSDAAAYNNYLMEESYLVVPLNGLPANKATALANLVRFALGPNGQRDISAFGAAPATTAMVTAGLQVANQLDTEAAQSAAQSSTSTTTTTSTMAPGGGAGGGTGTDPGSSAADGGAGAGAGGDGGGSTPALAFTGAPDLVPTVVFGALLAISGAVIRRRLRKRSARA
jgi:ABC-type phosphate transport system substrate-binding protein